MRPTIRMIAERAGVSRGTVDRVINNRQYVKEEVRQRVLQVMDELQYVPNRTAKVLSKSKQRLKIGVILPYWDLEYARKNILDGVADAVEELAGYGIEVLVEKCATEVPAECLGHVEALVEKGVAALAICAIDHDFIREKIDDLAEKGVPVITFNSDVTGCKRLCFVGQDLKRGGRVAAEILSKFLGPTGETLVVAGRLEFQAFHQRLAGFEARYAELGIEKTRCHIQENFADYLSTYQAVTEALHRHPKVQAIYIASESLPACLDAVEQVAMPQRVHAVGHDISEKAVYYLRTGQLDYVLDQDLYTQGWRPLLYLRDLLLLDKAPPAGSAYTDISILNLENINP